MVHVSKIANRRIGNAKDVVKREQVVYIKVITISGQKLNLSMREVDQNTGKDMLPLKKSFEFGSFMENPFGFKEEPTTRIGLSGIKNVDEDVVVPSRRPLKRMSSPDKWEVKQLIASVF